MLLHREVLRASDKLTSAVGGDHLLLAGHSGGIVAVSRVRGLVAGTVSEQEGMQGFASCTDPTQQGGGLR